MGGKSAPPAPDYTKAAEATAKSNAETTNMQTWANRADQYTPWGSQTWNTQSVIDPSTGQQVTKWVQNTSISPEVQAQLDAQNRIATAKNNLAETLVPRMQQEYGQAQDWSSLTPWAQAPMQTSNLQAITNPYGFGPRQGPTQNQYDYNNLQSVQGADAARQQATNAMYTQATSRLDPQWQQQQQQLEAQLANQGVTRGSDSYQQAMDAFQRQKTDAYNQAQQSAYAGGTQAAVAAQGMDLGLRQQQAQEAMSQGNLWNQMQAQRFGQGLQGGAQELQRQQQAFQQQQAAGGQNFQQQLAANQFQNQQRQQQLTEMMQQRGFSLNEINAILSGQQVSMPTFGGYTSASNSGGVDYSGAAKDQYSAAMDAYNAQQANSPLNAAASLAGSAMKAYTMSDRRVKREIRRIGRHTRGYGLYTYRFVGERGTRVGVIAQDVERIAPELVIRHRGVLMVHEGALHG